VNMSACRPICNPFPRANRSFCSPSEKQLLDTL
jgi:hypothetical protein